MLLHEEPVSTDVVAQGFNMLMQSVAKLYSERAEIVVAPRGKELGAESANPVLATRHWRPAWESPLTK
jgi:hypothetical protein